MPKSRKGHNGPKRPERAYPAVEAVVTPWIAHLDAEARLGALEEASRRAIAAGNPDYRIVKPQRMPKTLPPGFEIIPSSGLLLGPDGKPIGV